jgi:octaprenyl-diphosphate synthase
VPRKKDLYARLDSDLERFYAELRERLRSDVFLIDQGVRYLVKVRGKALRPFVVLASARLFGKPNDLTYRAAMIVELLHTATLIHDDVVDKADTRRGWPTFNRIWGNKYSVLFGDYLLAHSLIATLEKGNLEIVSLLADTARQMSQGQLKELSHARKRDAVRDSYLSMITDKTASLFRAGAMLGAMTQNANPRERDALRVYGENLGIAFQIRDDILDYVGRKKLLGKSIGSDLKQGKHTLPLILALESSPQKSKRKSARHFSSADRAADIKGLLKLVEDENGVNRAQAFAEEYAAKAISALDQTGLETSRILLMDLARYAAARTE